MAKTTTARTSAPTHSKAAPRVSSRIVAEGAARVAAIPPKVGANITVRALERGHYGMNGDDRVRNPGEVFEMNTQKMRRLPLAKGEHPLSAYPTVEITVDDETFELPPWVELVEEQVDPSERIEHGHKTMHGIQNGEVL
jgi:hypothetical protein